MGFIIFFIFFHCFFVRFVCMCVPKSNGTPIPCFSKIFTSYVKLMRWDHCEHASSNSMLSTINDRLLCNKIIGYKYWNTVEQQQKTNRNIHPYAWHSGFVKTNVGWRIKVCEWDLMFVAVWETVKWIYVFCRSETHTYTRIFTEGARNACPVFGTLLNYDTQKGTHWTCLQQKMNVPSPEN